VAPEGFVRVGCEVRHFSHISDSNLDLSDMMNETQDFPMATLIAIGSEQMLERAKANGLLVPMNGYKI